MAGAPSTSPPGRAFETPRMILVRERKGLIKVSGYARLRSAAADEDVTRNDHSIRSDNGCVFAPCVPPLCGHRSTRCPSRAVVRPGRRDFSAFELFQACQDGGHNACPLGGGVAFVLDGRETEVAEGVTECSVSLVP